MKPNFALSLSFDGLRLMHRVAGGWHLVGQVALDSSDLTAALADLHAAATGLEPDGIYTKLLIPNDQIKYLALDTTRTEEGDVWAALNGATPYAVEDLAYDFVKGGGRTYVAAVAKDTLTEAQQFANEHGFNPISFAAVPEPFTYVGEAFFGATEGNTAERDDEPVIVTGTSAALVDVVEPNVAPTPDVAPDVAEDDAAEDDAPDNIIPEVEAETTPDPEAELEPQDEAEVEADQSPAAPADDDADAEVPDPNHDAETPEADEGTEEAPLFASRLRADRSEGQPTPPPAPETPPVSGQRNEPTFSRATPPHLAVPTGQGTDAMPPVFAPARSDAPDPAPAPAPAISPETAQIDTAPAITGDAASALSSDAALAAASLVADRDHAAPAAPDADPSDTKGPAVAALGAASAVGGMFASRRMARADAKAKAAAATDSAEAEPEKKSGRSVFGARKQPRPKPVVGGKPRFLGLILTAVLLLFLLAFAAFAALSEDGIAAWLGFGNSDTQIAAEPAPTPATPDPTPVAASEVAAPQPDDSAVLAIAPDALAIPTAPSGGQVLSPEEATRIYAATGVWQRAPRIPLTPRTTSIDGMGLGAATQQVPRVPASPLISASEVVGDAVIAAVIDPPAPDITFDFGDDGLVVATQQGALTPDGIVVIVGRPALNPPTRPGTIAPEITPQDQLAAVIPDTATIVEDVQDGVIVVNGRPAIEPPVRTGTVAPVLDAPVLEAPVLAAPLETPNVAPDIAPVVIAEVPVPDPTPDPIPGPEFLAAPLGTTTLVATDDLVVRSGTPSILPPVRPGTVARPAALDVAIAPAVTPEIAPESAPETAPESLADTAPDPLPEGLIVIAGPPPVLPPARPGTVAPQNTSVADTLALDVAAALTTGTAQTPTPDTRRPLLRPAAVTQAALLVANAPALGALTADQAAAFRPRTRPAGLAPIPTPVIEADPGPTQEATTAIGLQISPEIAAAVEAAANRPDPIFNPTAQAVAISGRPDTRPRNMARIVARATQEQSRVATQVAAVPRAAAVAPSGPTAGAVARNATLENAINLRQVNLIGIFGGSNDRRALVRMANGNIVRVAVGDRLDGGRVTAISAGALSYSKSGRAITLEVAG